MNELRESLLQLAYRVQQLEYRLDDLAALLADRLPPDPPPDHAPPVDQALADYYGVCAHGRLLRDPCRHCGRGQR